ncbi:hypothetical protein OROHE_014209 [Orobanche hederae]
MEGRRNRKPLSDITNIYLIPTRDLCKLVAGSTDSNSFSKPPLSILKSSSVSSNQKLCSESSNRSDTSIGSSNVTGAWRTVQFRTPPYSVSSITPPENCKWFICWGEGLLCFSFFLSTTLFDEETLMDLWKSNEIQYGDTGSNDAAYNRMELKNPKDGEDAVMILSPTRVEKNKNKGKAIAVPFSSSPPEQLNKNQNEVPHPGSLLGREKLKGPAYRNLFSGQVDEIAEESNRRTLNPYSRHPYGKTEKGKAILSFSGCAVGKREDMAKVIMDHSRISLQKTVDGKKKTAMHCGSSDGGSKGILKRSRSPIAKTVETVKEFVNPSSFLVERTKEKGKPPNPVSSSSEKTMEKGKAIPQSSDVVEVTKPKGSAAAVMVNSRPPRRKSEKRKTDAGASSCPPLMRTKHLQIDLDEDGDIKSSKSWTDAQPKFKKKRPRIEVANELPLDFIEQQNVYFKEIDDFKLAEEEASGDELD